MSKLSATTSLGAVGLLVLAGTLAVASPAAAAPLDIAVSTPADLIQAITDTNANPGPDTIRVSGTLVLTNDLPAITDDLTMTGTGSATTVIDGDRFQQTISAQGTTADPISVAISGLTVTQRGGLSGAINSSYATLIVDDVVTSNSYVGITVMDGNATVTNSTAKDNSFAGVSLSAADGDSVYSVSGMTLTGNGGPGLQATMEGDSHLTVADSVSSGNDHGFSLFAFDDAKVELDGVKAIDNDRRGMFVVLGGNSDFSVSHSIVEGNTDGGIELLGDDGSGAAGSAATIASTTVRSNGTASADGGGGILIETPEGMAVTLSGSTVSGNTAKLGGGLYAFSASQTDSLGLTVVNSTISGNTGGTVGGVWTSLQVPGSHVAILNSTITDNVATNEGPGGVSLFNDIPFEIRNSIIAGNLDGPTFAADHFGDLDVDEDVAGVIDHSLIQDPASSAGAYLAAGTGNLTGVAAKLGPLADNGGATLTHLPLAGSPAINAGDPAFTGLTADQRGQTRVVGVLDMGAVEVQSALAVTGVDATAPLAGGFLLLGAGGLLLAVRHRRRRA